MQVVFAAFLGYFFNILGIKLDKNQLKSNKNQKKLQQVPGKNHKFYILPQPQKRVKIGEINIESLIKSQGS